MNAATHHASDALRCRTRFKASTRIFQALYVLLHPISGASGWRAAHVSLIASMLNLKPAAHAAHSRTWLVDYARLHAQVVR